MSLQWIIASPIAEGDSMSPHVTSLPTPLPFPVTKQGCRQLPPWRLKLRQSVQKLLTESSALAVSLF